MQRSSALTVALAVLLLASLPLACTDIEPSNPYDPGAPSTVQARATLTGRVVLESDEPAVGTEIGL